MVINYSNWSQMHKICSFTNVINYSNWFHKQKFQKQTP